MPLKLLFCRKSNFRFEYMCHIRAMVVTIHRCVRSFVCVRWSGLNFRKNSFESSVRVCVEQKCSFHWRSSYTMTIGIWVHCAIQFRFRSNHSISKSFSIQNGKQFIFMVNQQEISLYAIMCLVYEHKSLSSPFSRRVCDHCDVHSGSVPVSRWSNDFSEAHNMIDLRTDEFRFPLAFVI